MKKDDPPKVRYQLGAGLALSSMILGVFSPFVMAAAPPVWWSERGVVDQSATEANYAGVNLGQAKWAVDQAYAELSRVVPNGIGFSVSDLFPEKPVNPDAEWYKNQKKPLNIGQLKALAKPFYDKLNEVAQPWLIQQMQDNGLVLNVSYFKDPSTQDYYPWNPATAIENNYKAANIGQLKAVFSLRFRESRDADSIPDVWEYATLNAHPEVSSGDLTSLSDLSDADVDGVNDFQEYLNRTDPFLTDTDGDGLGDNHENSLASVWHLDETNGVIAIDDSGNTHDANIIGGLVFKPQGGVQGGGLYFDAAKAYLKLPHAVLDGAESMSFSLWYKTNGATGFNPFLSGANASNANRILIGGHLGTTPPRMEFWDTASKYWDQDSSWADGAWHHHVFVRDFITGEMRYYLDGVLAKSETGSFVALQIDPDGLLIGQDQDSVGGGFDDNQRLKGTIDEVRVYRRALNGVEVAEITNIDTDNDGLPDFWEHQIIDGDDNDALSTIEDVLPEDDFDGDGSDNLTEYQDKSDPVDILSYGADSDGDGIKDHVEIQYGFNPNDPADGIAGTNAAETLNGTSLAEILKSFEGNDNLYGNNGNDTLLGDEGDDKLYGGYGNDLLMGGPGNDHLDGSYGNDTYVLNWTLGCHIPVV